MSNSKLLILSFSLLFSFICFASSSSFNTTIKKCSRQQTLALLLFKENLSSINFPNDDPAFDTIDYQCRRWFGSDYYPIVMNWSTRFDCCNWDGITCDHFTGDVIGIDLRCGMLRGTLHPNTSLFDLPRLQTLNLAYNDFNASYLPRELGRLSNSLTHLNISGCRLTGDIPWEILFLPKLISLDLSLNFGLRMQPDNLNNLLRSSTHLRELLISGVGIGWFLPAYLNISSSVKSLDLRSTGLQGKLPDNMFNLPYLEKLELSENYLTGPWPEINKSINIPLKWLGLTETNLSGEKFGSIGHLTSLRYLDLSYCGMVGSFPKSLLNLTGLTALHLGGNMLNGTLPSLLFTLPSIEEVFLGYNLFSGGLPPELFKCRSLKAFSIGRNQLDGEINQGSTPSLFIQLINLTYLDLAINNFKGEWNFETLLSSLPNLQELDLAYSGLSIVTEISTSYINPDFRILDLTFCNLNAIPESLRAMKKLEALYLQGNNIQGCIPNWAREIGGNRFFSLDLSNNFITGLPQLQWDGLLQLSLRSNMIQGPFPPSICNMRSLRYLDLSNNSFDGVVPRCLGKISSLLIINLAANRFRGTIPNVWADYGKLKWLLLNKNQFEGEVPVSLSKCRDMKILDLGNNQLNGTFPGWLADLRGLQVLVLKSNNFHGTIETSSTIKLPFPLLRVLDLSYNRFVGQLPEKYFQYFNAMKDMVRTGSKPEYLTFNGMYYSLIVGVKGQQLPFPQLWDDYTIIDLSSNKFEGEIPDIVGTLNSLIVLNLSHNNLNGRIPHALGSLVEIESLDLSWNQLTGEIPQSLADITDLEVLNLSHNHLVGRIPQGTQFNTFEGNSFGGNSGLCGFPLPKHCEDPSSPQHEVIDGNGDEEESGFTWKVVMLGYGCGTLPGLVIAHVMLSIGKPKWFNAIVDAGENMIHTWINKRRRYIFIGK